MGDRNISGLRGGEQSTNVEANARVLDCAIITCMLSDLSIQKQVTVRVKHPFCSCSCRPYGLLVYGPNPVNVTVNRNRAHFLLHYLKSRLVRMVAKAVSKCNDVHSEAIIVKMEVS